MSQQLFFTNEATGLTSLTTVHPPTAMHLIEVGAHQRRDPRWRRQNPPVWGSPDERAPPPPPMPPPHQPPPLPPPPPPPLPPMPEYVHEWLTSVHVSFRRRAPPFSPGRGLTICKTRFQKRLKKIRCIDLTRD